MTARSACTHFLPFSAQDFGEESTEGFLQP
jgi:hypothetical protein